ncbi:fusaric acid resistance protein [Caballeronia jiangsuensis]|nr:fusaric acid resistance protein [Caballeronia jiangsuensis]
MNGINCSRTLKADGSQSLSFQSLGAGLTDWWGTSGPLWIYVCKTVLAVILALLIAMRLNLPQPRTAMITVFILMQPQSGLVLAKSVFRFFGTAVGLAVMLFFVSLFAQQPVLYLTAVALWVCVCTTGAARNRNFRSYGFVLAGYTAALIGIPVGQQPDGAFISAMTRVAETSVGIVCAGAVSALVLPSYIGAQIKAVMRKRFGMLSEHLANALTGTVERSETELTHTYFLEQVIGLEAARSVGVFELPDMRVRGRRLARANMEFMNVATRLRTLHEQWEFIRIQGGPEVAILDVILSEISPLLRHEGNPIKTAADAAQATGPLSAFRLGLAERVSRRRRELAGEDETALRRFDTCAELFQTFVDDLVEYVETYASLATHSHMRETWTGSFIPKTNMVAALIAGSRAALLTGVLSAFWIETGWPSGGTMVLAATAVCALAATSPQPARFSMQMSIGTTLAVFLGGFLQFEIYPRIDGFPLLAFCLTPFMLFGAVMMARPKTLGIGIGFCIFFSFMAGPDLIMQYEPYSFINDSVALMIAMLVVWLSFAVVFPTDGKWLRWILMRDLRRQVVLACGGRGKDLATRFESGSRDVVSQMNAVAPGGTGRTESARWLLLVLSVGRTVIDLRGELAELHVSRTSPGELKEWRSDLGALLRRIAALFKRIEAKRLAEVLRRLDKLTEATLPLTTCPTLSDKERLSLRRSLSLLEYLKVTLQNEKSPLSDCADPQIRRSHSKLEKPDHVS